MNLNYIDQERALLEIKQSIQAKETQADILKISLGSFLESHPSEKGKVSTEKCLADFAGIHAFPAEIYDAILYHCALPDQNAIAGTCKAYLKTQRFYFKYSKVRKLQKTYLTLLKSSREGLLRSTQSISFILEPIPSIAHVTPAHIDIAQKLITLMVNQVKCRSVHFKKLRETNPGLTDAALKGYLKSSGGLESPAEIIERFNSDMIWSTNIFLFYFEQNIEYEMAKRRNVFISSPRYLWKTLKFKKIHDYNFGEFNYENNDEYKKILILYFEIMARYFRRIDDPELHLSLSTTIEDEDSVDFAGKILEIFKNIPRLIKLRIAGLGGFNNSQTKAIVKFIKSNPNLISLNLPLKDISSQNKRKILRHLQKSKIHPKSHVYKICALDE